MGGRGEMLGMKNLLKRYSTAVVLRVLVLPFNGAPSFCDTTSTRGRRDAIVSRFGDLCSVAPGRELNLTRVAAVFAPRMYPVLRFVLFIA